MKNTQWDIINKDGIIVEGGFFSRDIAIETQQKDYPDCKVIKHK